MSASTDVVTLGSNVTPEEAQIQATITVGSVVVLGLAAVGAYVVTKKVVADAKANWKIRKEMKALYKEHRKVKTA